MKKTIKKYVIPTKENNFRPHFLRATGVLAMFLVIVGIFFGSQLQRIALTTSNFLASVLPSVLVDLANADRTSNQLGTLTINAQLEEAARMKAEDMMAQARGIG
jgi:hypothetical protein